jgi:TolB protein
MTSARPVTFPVPSPTEKTAEPTARGHWRVLEPGQVAQLVVFDLDAGVGEVLYESSDTLFEAPNWTADGNALLVNADGRMYRLPADGGGEPTLLDTGSVQDANNDHVLSADGSHLYLSSQDAHLYQVPAGGGAALRVTDDGDGLGARYLHGISPDGGTLAFIGAPAPGSSDRGAPAGGPSAYNVYTLDLASGKVRRITDSDRAHDGSEYSPDGEWIYFNSERASSTPGHAQLFRMRPDGSDVQQLTADERVNWFPHPSPDGSTLLYLSYEPGTQGHPANRHVELRLADPLAGNPRTVATLLGGQGTVNVNSWAPDSRRFAYVAYPLMQD